MSSTSSTSAATCTVVPKGQGPAFWIVGDHIQFKLGANKTGGRFAFAEAIVEPGGGPPPHVHLRDDEMFYVLDGEFDFVAEQTVRRARPGDALYMHKGRVHAFRNVSAEPGRLLICAAPAGFEAFVADGGCTATEGVARPPQHDEAAIGRLMAACAKHGLEMRFDHQPAGPAADRAPDRQYWVLGEHVRMKLTAADTNGHFSLAEVTTRPGGGVPPHAHHAMDEIFYVRAGEYEFAVGGQALCADPGTFVHVPPGVVHGFRNVGSTPGTLIDYHTPGGFEAFFEECGVPADGHAAPPPPPAPEEMPRLLGIFEKHGMSVPRG